MFIGLSYISEKSSMKIDYTENWLHQILKIFIQQYNMLNKLIIIYFNFPIFISERDRKMSTKYFIKNNYISNFRGQNWFIASILLASMYLITCYDITNITSWRIIGGNNQTHSLISKNQLKSTWTDTQVTPIVHVIQILNHPPIKIDKKKTNQVYINWSNDRSNKATSYDNMNLEKSLKRTYSMGTTINLSNKTT